MSVRLCAVFCLVVNLTVLLCCCSPADCCLKRVVPHMILCYSNGCNGYQLLELMGVWCRWQRSWGLAHRCSQLQSLSRLAQQNPEALIHLQGKAGDSGLV